MGLFVTINIFFAETITYRDRGQEHAPPRGAPSTSSLTSVVAAAGATDSTSQGACHRHLLQLQWWLLLELSTAPPWGPAIDVFFNFGGGCCWSYWQHLPGGSHQGLIQPQWWLLSELPAETIDIWLNLVPVISIFLATPTRGPLR
jgi:hypothetical protein